MLNIFNKFFHLPNHKLTSFISTGASIIATTSHEATLSSVTTEYTPTGKIREKILFCSKVIRSKLVDCHVQPLSFVLVVIEMALNVEISKIDFKLITKNQSSTRPLSKLLVLRIFFLFQCIEKSQ